MWLKLKSGAHLNMQNGYMMGVREVVRPDQKNDWRVWINTGLGQPMHTVEEGYPTEAEAQNALDELMSAQELVRVSPPNRDEEKTDDEQLELIERTDEEVK